jgi:hypothetical protein
MSPFMYLLNAFEEASQADEPAKWGYGERRRKLIEYVTKLERAWAVKLERECDDIVVDASPSGDSHEV